MNTGSYGITAKTLHWGMAALIIGMLILGFVMTSRDFNPDTLKLYGWHKSVGSLILALAAFRLTWRWTHRPPALPATMPKPQQLAAHLGHYGLYALMFAMPFSGWLMSSAAGFPVSVFGLLTLPDLIAPSKELHEILETIHELLAFALIGLISIHALAALYHHFHEKDDILRRMLPALLIALTLTFSSQAHAEAKRWNIDPTKSSIAFTATQNNSPVQGSFSEFTGTIAFSPEDLATSQATITINTASVTASYGDVTNTLKTPDWFNAAAFPTATFKTTAFKHLSGNQYEATATLTIRDKTLPITLPFTLETYTDTSATITAETTLKRTAFGIGQGSWSDTSTVKDDVKVTIKLTATP